MRVLLQRVISGGVEVDGQCTGRIDSGVVLLVGIGQGDSGHTVQAMAEKIVTMRIFNDRHDRFDQSLLDVGGGALVVSQFTLYADTTRGRRPSFSRAAPPQEARPLVDQFAVNLEYLGVSPVATGRFGAHMAVEIHNDGPVTIWIDSADCSTR